MFSEEILHQTEKLLKTCSKKKLKLATVESCTGGLISAVLTAIPGSSDVFDRGFLTYSNEAKIELVGVPPKIIIDHGSVSEETAIAMAEGALIRSNANISLSVTGIAGPGGGNAEKPVGLVFFACAIREGKTHANSFVFKGSRTIIRIKSVKKGLQIIENTAFS
ncbi:MAG: damage-inducible protein CinA [Rhodospirillaceae bacterium]|nr:damage-inducible protein CinA [Rhodospirillaceae bacterium]